nr:anti-phage BREX system Lon protease BrxL [Leptotrichia trevisanii]
MTKKIKEGANVPVYVLEYLLGMYCSSINNEDIEEGLKIVKKYWLKIMFVQMKQKK